jgi:lipoprotein-anchoring transpeptidase ErfK/SrfK
VSLRIIIALLGVVSFLAGCAKDTRHLVLISTSDQQMIVLRDDIKISQYPVSTSKFGVGDAPNSKATPVGLLRIRKKIGNRAPAGTVFKSRRPTGEILPVDAPGRDPIVSRILWLEGLEPRNRNAFGRYIYIHGTPEERNIGVATSFGCIRMRSLDVIRLYDTVGTGARVLITTRPFNDSNNPLGLVE